MVEVVPRPCQKLRACLCHLGAFFCAISVIFCAILVLFEFFSQYLGAILCECGAMFAIFVQFGFLGRFGAFFVSFWC